MKLFGRKKKENAASEEDEAFQYVESPDAEPTPVVAPSAPQPVSTKAAPSEATVDVEAAVSPKALVKESKVEEKVTLDGALNDEASVSASRFSVPTQGDQTEVTKDSAFTITRGGQFLTMNSFANGHLMRWKFAAEEGPALIRIPAILFALGSICATIFVLLAPDWWNLTSLICSTHTIILNSFILVLEGRVLCGVRGPRHVRAQLRAGIIRYFNICRLLWGRGLLYIYAGSMSLTILNEYSEMCGYGLVCMGIFALLSGAHASYNLDKIKTSLTDEAYLWAKFDQCDSDSDNKIDLDGFAELLWTLGLEFDDAYTQKAFNQIDDTTNALITFEQFRDWWIVTQNSGRKLRNSAAPV
eukprot:Nitzschia sp. Nitz4//scaffold62_size106224//1694//2764//NITZ4_004337-RA/size106224-processed-gene-0.22-mRNA-1//1//CDS//3329555799//85//frame0